MKTVAVVALAAASGLASADPLFFEGVPSGSTSGTGSNYSGTLNYTPSTATTGVLVMNLTNDTPGAVGGRMTGVAIRWDDTGASASLASTDTNFTDTGSPTSASPFGDFLGGAALGGNWVGGGSPNPGVAPGGTGTFTWNITSDNAGSLTNEDFNYPISIAVRFRGIPNPDPTGEGLSDKVPNPAPGAVALAGLAGLSASRRRR